MSPGGRGGLLCRGISCQNLLNINKLPPPHSLSLPLPSRLLLRHVPEEESESGSYYPDEGTCDDPDAELSIQGQCSIIVDFNTCDDSPATRLFPGFTMAAVAAILTAIAAAIALP